MFNDDPQTDNKKIEFYDLLRIVSMHKLKLVLITFIVIICSLFYVMTLPNKYKSEVTLITNDSKRNLASNFSSLASFAGIEVNSASKSPFIMMNTILNDYSFHLFLIDKYNLMEKLNNSGNRVFAFNFDKIYYMFNNQVKKDVSISEINKFNTAQNLMSMIKVNFDTKTNIIVLSVIHEDRYLAKELVDLYLFNLINKIKNQDMKEIDKQIKYYKKELGITSNVLLREQLSKSLSSLMQKKVFSQANDFYTVSKIIDSRVPNITEKIGPKRSNIIIMILFTTITFLLILIFLFEYLKNNEKN